MFDQELEQAMQERGIDLREIQLTQKQARDVLYKEYRLNEQMKEFKEITERLGRDVKLREKYYG